MSKASRLAANLALQSRLEALEARRTEPAPVNRFILDCPHLIVRARAGTGKTTTLVEGLKRVKGITSSLTPSPQQEVVWEQMEKSKDARSICFVAFNKSIAEELKNRVPAGCDASTMHSLGFKAVNRAFGRVGSVNQYRVQNIIGDLLNRDVFELRREKPLLVSGTEYLVSYCKMQLCTGTKDELDRLSSYYEVELNGSRDDVYELVSQVLERCKDVRRDNAVDYDDMIWLPIALDLPLIQNDLLLVDEAQDLNRCQQALARRSGKRLVFVGDDRQAIYGFAGADCDSLDRLAEELGETEAGCTVLPLTVTRRCGRAIVTEAQKYVPDFEAHESNPEGVILKGHYPARNAPDPIKSSFMKTVQDGDMILCRCNAPLVGTCFKFLKAGRKANIQGRDIGQGLISTIKKLKAQDCKDLVSRLGNWVMAETAKENAKKFPNDNKLVAIQDRYDCLLCFIEGETSVQSVIRRIEQVFTDDKKSPGIKLSSIHKAKGLEAENVFILQLDKASVPHPMAKTEWAKAQEINLLYVAITRAISTLTYVYGKTGDNDSD